ncbi:MAG: bifunctional phosphopantothenoylcysteine decarboxylase/phosphopantothenate--cysteine ligase CoaBC [Proteobacteria bacterium]|nr:bifunctional phosphopantothenoylcysteine decarboxylase/phosphopantothenate--cysteine ligase CoaBC [Pseudomonadota bacterium]MCL2307741.1 bifunctional phosphopantothenoylcysteine decarboxylase/phosphopantothenate--cysteine ligase CoaBC [Pseudomonadota bacterium]MCL2308381.1 bifunctional phosphopantothenoylcysteine decarboxylase/phosphopantothenate--cysteine ligase CoaBC [Pseudomonadota bacterium]
MKTSQPRIVLGITGSIAAYKAAELTRLWVKAGITVDVVMTEAACRFIAPLTLQALSGRPVWTAMWDGSQDGMQHIALSRGAQAIVVAPASADFLARTAQGRADEALSALCLARECPMFVAPAMNVQMWTHPATQRNVARLRADGVKVLGPDSGELACGEIGEGRMLSPEAIAAAVSAHLADDAAFGTLLAGRRVLLTAGPTFEAIDPVRGLTNRSSGKMGFALAQAAAQAGAEVTLIAGPVALPTPSGVTRVDVISAQDMADAVFAHIDRADIFIGVAAVADYAPAAPAAQKIKKETSDTLTLTLRPTVDILAELAKRDERAPKVFRVGFAAETQDIAALGEAKRRRKHLPLLIANRAQDAINADDNEVILLDDDGAHPLPRMDKTLLARRLVEEIARRFVPLSPCGRGARGEG